MPLHFETGEYQLRVEKAQSLLRQQELDGLLLFAPESHYYLSGYDTFGFAMFQCMVLPASGSIQLLTRAPDLRQAQFTSTLPDEHIHIWRDTETADPYTQLLALLQTMQLTGCRLGIETQTPGLTAWHWQQLTRANDAQPSQNRIAFIEASQLVQQLRRYKSPAEIHYTRRAAALSDDALDAALVATHGGAFEGDILAAMQGAVFAGGGDYAGNEFIIGSAEGALLCRYFSGRRHLQETDQLTLEWSGSYRRYHAAMMRTLIIGKANKKQLAMHAAATDALIACEDAIQPGAAMGDVFTAHANVFDSHGLAHARLNACGYGMGATYNPIWVEFPMFYEDNPLPVEIGNVFFLHMILMDSSAGLAMCWGHSVLVTAQGVERLSRHALDLVECPANKA